MEENQEVKEVSDEKFEIEDVSMDDIFSNIFTCLPNQKLEFFRTRGTVIKDDEGNFIKERDGSNKRTQGHKKGVMLAYEDPETGQIVIGFSLCHKRDRFDYRQGMRMDNLGIWYACNKANKHKDSKRFAISTKPEDRQLSKRIVKIPQSMAKDFAKFIARCRRYYKDKDLPEWATNFALEQLPKSGGMIEDKTA
jgi:hypothetical protein